MRQMMSSQVGFRVWGLGGAWGRGLKSVFVTAHGT